jgi:hypothetical protein
MEEMSWERIQSRGEKVKKMKIMKAASERNKKRGLRREKERHDK